MSCRGRYHAGRSSGSTSASLGMNDSAPVMNQIDIRAGMRRAGRPPRRTAAGLLVGVRCPSVLTIDTGAAGVVMESSLLIWSW